MELGVCYYPEHWPEERWAIDAKLMREAGLSIVRLGDFAWGKIEPAPGDYRWDWLDKAIQTISTEGHQIVLCTPTAAPPAWLCTLHPDILPVDNQGRKRNYGSRRHYCPNSPRYQEFSQQIVSALAKRYGNHPSLIAWQIDNELGYHNTARCYCENCANAFRVWLQKKYMTIDNLNQSWGTVFWSQGYDDWSQIIPPMQIVAEPNPSQVLDYFRFSSDSVVYYQQLQINLLREYSPGRLLTTNFMGNFSDLDYFDLAQSLDLVGWDNYPSAQAEMQGGDFYLPLDSRPQLAFDVGDPYITGYCHDIMRGIKQKPVWILEHQVGCISGGIYNVMVSPNTLRLWTWYDLLMGVEKILYFRWRACLYGQEQLLDGLLHHDASFTYGYYDLLTMKKERLLMDQISIMEIRPQVAILLNYDDQWTIQSQPHRQDFSYQRYLFTFYRALRQLGIEVDILPVNADLRRYKIVIAPTLPIENPELSKSLCQFVQDGGVLLIGIRSGSKTSTNLSENQVLPGIYRYLTGIHVGEWGSLSPGVTIGISATIPKLEGPVSTWVETLITLEEDLIDKGSLQILAKYTSSPFISQAALTINKMGKGCACYLGFYPRVEQAKAIVSHLANEAGIPIMEDLPEGLIFAQRGNHTVLMNFTDETKKTIIPAGKEVEVNPRDILVI
jgi:beta-galactosidase